MNDSESSEVTATDRNPAVENAATSGPSEPGTDQRKKGKGCLIATGKGAGVVLLVALVLEFCTPSLKKKRHVEDQMIAMNNGKYLMLTLNDFATEYGSFPDQETAKAVKERTKTTLDLDGDTANHYFRQLVAAGVAPSEDPFYARTPYSLKRPDKNRRGSMALMPGEVGFGYLMNGSKSLPGEDPNRVIAATPLLDATASGEFDPGPFDGKAVLVLLDRSVRLVDIRDADHRVMVSPGKTLLENGPGTIWDPAITPVIKPPLTPPQWKPGQSMPNYRPKQPWFWPICLLGGGLALGLIAAWAVWRKDGGRQ